MSVPNGCLDLIQKFRSTVTDITVFLQQFVGQGLEANLDIDKIQQLSAAVAAQVEVPPRCRMITHKAEALDAIQFQRYEQFKDFFWTKTGTLLKMPDAVFRGTALLC